VEIVINGINYEVEEEKSVLEVARREGIDIPTLCYHPALESYGACRLCLVEVKGGGRLGLAASCVLPVSDGLVVETDSDRVLQARRTILKLLLSACPEVPAVKELAARLGVAETPYLSKENSNGCTLCGQCVRVCEKIGMRAIGFAFRGPLRKVTGPWDKTPEVCLACRACENVCPIGLVKFTEDKDTISGEPWHANVPLAKCSRCGKPFASQTLLEYLHNTVDLDVDICSDCRKKELGQTWLRTALPDVHNI
jgi:bidirectional [NiFe] hydrogenase diaphorase subunit